MVLIRGARVDEVPSTTPVLIAGGGPSGLFLALDLAHRGIRSVVVEPRITVDPHRPRAKTTNARTMTHLRRLGLADLLRQASPLTADYSEDVLFCSTLTGFEITRFHNAFQVVRGRYDLQPEGGQQVAQPIVEEVLREAARVSPLVTLATGLRVTEVASNTLIAEAPAAGPHTVEITDDTGATRTVSADYLVGADGGTSVVRKSQGIALEGSSAGRSNLNVLFRSRGLGERVALGPAIQYWVMAPGASGIVGRADLDSTWWAIVQGVDAQNDDLDPVAIVRQMAGADIDVEVVSTDPWTARMLLAASYGRDGVFLLGDAAHLNPPWGGHGFNTCIGDAANLAWKLAALIDGWGGELLLASYEQERRPVAQRTIADAAANGSALAYHFADEALGQSGDLGEQVRAAARAALEVKRSEFISLGLVLGYHYGSSAIIADDGTPAPTEDPIAYEPTARPGSVLPHAWLADGTSLYDLLDDRGFTVLVDRADPDPACPSFSPLTDAAMPNGIPLRVVELSPGLAPVGALAAAWQAPIIIVRPDQHVAWRGESLDEAATWLRRAAGWADPER